MSLGDVWGSSDKPSYLNTELEQKKELMRRIEHEFLTNSLIKNLDTKIVLGATEDEFTALAVFEPEKLPLWRLKEMAQLMDLKIGEKTAELAQKKADWDLAAWT